MAGLPPTLVVPIAFSEKRANQILHSHGIRFAIDVILTSVGKYALQPRDFRKLEDTIEERDNAPGGKQAPVALASEVRQRFSRR